jgi:antitoxin FitA
MARRSRHHRSKTNALAFIANGGNDFIIDMPICPPAPHAPRHFGNAIIDSNLLHGATMSQLVVRNIEPEIVEALRQRAAAANISAEEQHRRLLREALARPRKLTFEELILSMPNGGRDEDFERDYEQTMRPDPFES